MRTARSLRLPYLVRLLTVALACCLALAVFTPRSQAAPLPAPPAADGGAGALAPQPAPDAAQSAHEADHGRAAVPARERAPIAVSATRPTVDADPAAADPAAKQNGLGAPSTAQAACNVGDFTGRTGSALVQAVKAAEVSCINTLFNLTGSDARGAFREEQMTAVAWALRDASAAYPGDNSTSVSQLVLFLRAGYFVQWYHPGDVGTYGTALRTAIRGALDAYFGSARSRDVTDANARILGEAVILVDSAQENTHYLPLVKRLLVETDSSRFPSVPSMAGALNGVFTVLWRGHQTAGFADAVRADQGVLDAVHRFADGNGALLGTDLGYVVYNASRELGRFLQYEDLRGKLRPLYKGLADRSAPSGRTAHQWAAVAEMADEYDAGNCSYYGTCDAPNRLRTGILTVAHTCSPSIRIAAQQMTAENLAATCTSLLNQDAYFHAVAKDSGPVADDRNSTIEVVVFDTKFDYGVFAAAIFGIRTDNGGMYLEGNPATPGNLPRFLAYEATWLRPAFEIWNLNHEYTHYLDGRFDMFGDFTANMTTPTVWWVEGFAEYVSYSYRKETYQAAIDEAGRHTHKLSTLFDTTYDNADSTRIYRWGYLAVRYMLEKHRADLDAVLAKYRTGDWNGARSLLKTTIGTRYDADFDSWLTACASGGCGTTTPPGNQAPTAAFGAAISGQNVSFTDRSTDPDGRIASRVWNFGDGTGSTVANPYKTYSAAGTYTVSLTVTDDKGAKATSTQSLVVGAASECPGGDIRVLGQNCRRSNIGATAGNYAHFYLYVPAGTARVTVSSAGGTGNADLYYSSSSWAYTHAYTSRSAGPGNTETLTITNPPAGYVYFSLHSEQGFGGVTVTARY
ncbi:collagenase [Kitasatospora sp. NPDC054939]